LHKKELCNTLNVSLSSVDRMIRSGILAAPYLNRLGRSVRIIPDFLDALPRILQERSERVKRGDKNA
jgi:hypothetical protein